MIMTLYLRRRTRFSAASTGSRSGVPKGGFSYLCEVMVGGSIDEQTGMVVNIRDIDAVMKHRVVSVLDGKILDLEVTAFEDRSPTPENITRFIWAECFAALPKQATLAQVTLWPTPAVWATISNLHTQKDNPMLTMTRAYDFSASHRLHSNQLSDSENAEIFGKCNWTNGHGHNYDVEVTLTGEVNPITSQIIAPEILDEIVDQEVIKPFDHKHLNFDTADFANLNPTSENLTRVIWDRLAPRIAALGHSDAQLYRVIVRETARNYFEYYGE